MIKDYAAPSPYEAKPCAIYIVFYRVPINLTVSKHAQSLHQAAGRDASFLSESKSGSCAGGCLDFTSRQCTLAFQQSNCHPEAVSSMHYAEPRATYCPVQPRASFVPSISLQELGCPARKLFSVSYWFAVYLCVHVDCAMMLLKSNLCELYVVL
jgi:hypothetical protein